MIPYFTLTGIAIGPARLQAWGFFVSLGLLVTVILGRREARRRDLDPDTFLDFAAWAAIGGVIGARLFYILFYGAQPFGDMLASVFRLWDGGMSIFGGFFGGAVGSLLYFARRRGNFFRYADVAALYLPLGCAIGRIGCFLIHDHLGTLSSLPIAVAFPGGARLDHGLLLSLFNLAIFLGFLVWRKRRGGALPYLAAYMTVYGTGRFLLDFARAWDTLPADPRFFWLTPAQYASVALVGGGLWLWIRRQKASRKA